MCRLLAITSDRKRDFTLELASVLSAYSMQHRDGMGVCWQNENRLNLFKSTLPAVSVFSRHALNFNCKAVLAHVRYATHGGNSLCNTHPFASEKQDFVLAHNGVLMGFEALKERYISEGMTFTGETDSEILVKIIEKEGVDKLFDVLHRENIFGSANVIVLFNNGTMYVFADTSLYMVEEHTKITFVSDDEIYKNAVRISPNTLIIAKNGKIISKKKLNRAAALPTFDTEPFIGFTEYNSEDEQEGTW